MLLLRNSYFCWFLEEDIPKDPEARELKKLVASLNKDTTYLNHQIFNINQKIDEIGKSSNNALRYLDKYHCEQLDIYNEVASKNSIKNKNFK